MLRRLLSLLLLACLALGGGAECCLPSAAAADEAPAKGGCHEAPTDDAAAPEPADPVAPADAGCGSCSHCLTSAPLTVAVRIAVLAPPMDGGLPALLAHGLPAYAPPLRPPIDCASDPIA